MGYTFQVGYLFPNGLYHGPDAAGSSHHSPARGLLNLQRSRRHFLQIFKDEMTAIIRPTFLSFMGYS